jgi:hypothetical protein
LDRRPGLGSLIGTARKPPPWRRFCTIATWGA